MSTDRITWDDVQAVYPDIPLDELKAQLAGYGYKDTEYSLDALTFEVITEGSWAGWSNEGQCWIRHDEPNFWPFEKGGILLVMASGREPFGMGRKSRKWWVTGEEFPTLVEAKARSEEVKAAPAKGHGEPSDYDYLFNEEEWQS